jgi:hypothetical protein
MSDQVYTLGVWGVKNGKEDEFVPARDWSQLILCPRGQLAGGAQSARRPGEAR